MHEGRKIYNSIHLCQAAIAVTYYQMKCFKLSNNHSLEGDDDIIVIGDT